MKAHNNVQRSAMIAAFLGFSAVFPDFSALKVALLFLPCSLGSVTTETAVAATFFLPFHYHSKTEPLPSPRTLSV